jgi:CNT family concentrative nucleoside transporter
MGTPLQDCLAVGRLLGEKLILTEFVAYADLAGTLQSGAAGNRAGVGSAFDCAGVLRVKRLREFRLHRHPDRRDFLLSHHLARHEIARLGLKAMIGGAITSYIIACVAGAFYSGVSMLGL